MKTLDERAALLPPILERKKLDTRSEEYVEKRIQRLTEKVRELETIAPNFVMPRGNTAQAALRSSRLALKRWLRIRESRYVEPAKYGL